MDQDSPQPGAEPSASLPSASLPSASPPGAASPADDALAVLRRPAIRLMLAVSLAVGAGIGGFVIANAATASPAPSASPGSSTAPPQTNCPNMPNM